MNEREKWLMTYPMFYLRFIAKGNGLDHRGDRKALVKRIAKFEKSKGWTPKAIAQRVSRAAIAQCRYYNAGGGLCKIGCEPHHIARLNYCPWDGRPDPDNGSPTKHECQCYG